jgi:protein-ribulosamine 3-kinase
MEQVFREVEKKLAETVGESLKIVAAHNLGGGCINRAAKLETSAGIFFLKWNASCPPDFFEKEAEGLCELARAAGTRLIVPGVICHKKPDETPAFLVLDYLVPGAMQRSDEELGRGLAQIHRYTKQWFGFYSDNYCGATPQQNDTSDSWLHFYRDRRLGFLLNLIENKRGLTNSEKKIYMQLLDRLPDLIPGDAKPALIHGDLWSGNVMYTAYGPALIDPAVYYADREMEFAIVTLFGGFSSRFFEAYREAFPPDQGWKERNRLYQLYHILNHYYLFGGGYGSQALSVAKSYR